jgi:hypothetical protein
MAIYSTEEELKSIACYLAAYMRIPFFQDDTIPGKIMEKIISIVHSGVQLATYDYVDVVKKGDVGWQVKSTKSSTPLTWKRAKIPDSTTLISKSENSETGRQELGDAIIDFCNAHAADSLEKYELNEIGYSRLIMFEDNTAIYFERLLCSKQNKLIFDKKDYAWQWSTQKQANKKEQLTALHGTNIITKKKAFAWHGRGENQLHFSGEGDWWPDIETPNKFGEIKFSKDRHAIKFKLSPEKVDWEKLTGFLSNPT